MITLLRAFLGDIVSEKQCQICLRLHEKTFGNQKFLRGRPPRPFTVKYCFCQILNHPLTEKLDPPLVHTNIPGLISWLKIATNLTRPQPIKLDAPKTHRAYIHTVIRVSNICRFIRINQFKTATASITLG